MYRDLIRMGRKGVVHVIRRNLRPCYRARSRSVGVSVLLEKMRPSPNLTPRVRLCRARMRDITAVSMN